MLPWLSASSGEPGVENCAADADGVGRAGRARARRRATAGGPAARRRCQRRLKVVCRARARRAATRSQRRRRLAVKLRRPAAERPADLAARGVDVVERPGVAARDEQRPVGFEVDRVEVEEVEGPRARACPAARSRTRESGTWSRQVHSSITRPVVMSISWTSASVTALRRGRRQPARSQRSGS